jgi:hypothetical protein
MRKLSVLIITIGFIFTFNSCEQSVELDVPGQTPKMVLQGSLNSDENLVLDLRRSFTIKDRNNYDLWYNQQIDNPSIQLFKDNVLVGILSPDIESNLKYILNYSNFRAGEKYTLIGNATGYQSINAETVIPDKPDVTITDFVFSGTTYDLTFSMNVNIKDNPTQEDYYTISIPSDDEYPIYLGNDSEEGNNDPSVTVVNGIYFINDRLFNGNTKKIVVNSNFYFPWKIKSKQIDSLRVDCKAITKDYYDYMITTSKQNYNDFDFFAEPVLIKHNITGGFGVLGASNKVRIALALKQKK